MGCCGAGSPGATRTRFPLTLGPHPYQPRGPTLPVQPPAARALFRAARPERSAHNEELSDVAAVPEPAGGSQDGREGRKKPVGPGVQLPCPPLTEGPRLGGGAAAQGRAQEGPG